MAAVVGESAAVVTSLEAHQLLVVGYCAAAGVFPVFPVFPVVPVVPAAGWVVMSVTMPGVFQALPGEAARKVSAEKVMRKTKCQCPVLFVQQQHDPSCHAFTHTHTHTHAHAHAHAHAHTHIPTRTHAHAHPLCLYRLLEIERAGSHASVCWRSFGVMVSEMCEGCDPSRERLRVVRQQMQWLCSCGHANQKAVSVTTGSNK